ncbi:DNA-directed RNA polymerase III subunit RPC4-like isoform X2 [Pectinophora gossypiella]|uniref:DNA-directed RNA polymerase III subunit RPC4 n=1 Tax=Pectinophora gossypiella TaxID=13191 RepID=A0A1E1WPD6_PECGO|nr:DNA-directed RNA polymerase III subunit RPC4-like isoform X2 [Pectinophora gossypiella]
MSNSEEKKMPKTNGAGIDMSERLATFKPPRDYTLGGVKTNRKVFTPNLNVSRNKTKGPSAGNKEQKKEEKGKRDRNKNERNKNFRNGANIIKSGGVFSEGLGGGQRQASRGSYNRDSESTTPVLQRPTIRVKDVVKIDKELEEQKIKAVMSRGTFSDDDSEDFKDVVNKNAPIKLPMDDGAPPDTKPVVEMKPKVTVKKEVLDNSDLVDLLRSDQSTLMLVKLPDTLPGRGPGGDDSPPHRKSRDQLTTTPAAPSDPDDESIPADIRCRLKDLEEGQIGKLRIHHSGRVTMALGKTIFEVSLGTKSAFHQEVVSMAVDEASRSATLVSLGAVQHKLNIVPDWEALFQEAGGRL